MYYLTNFHLNLKLVDIIQGDKDTNNNPHNIQIISKYSYFK